MKKKTFNSFLILVISFFLIAVTANAETVESTIKYGETVDVSEKLGMSGQAVDSVIEVSKSNGASGEEVLSYNCSGTTCTCQLKDTGLWHMSVHITVKYANGQVKTLNLRIVDFWPIRAYLGNYNTDWSYDSSKWDSDNGNLTNSLTITSKTRSQVVLPNVGNVDTTSANTGLPVKFIGFVKMQDVDQLTGEGSTMQVTMPVQKKGMCEKGGRVGDVAGAYGEFVAAGTTINGTGPYIYVSCYEYREVAFLSLAGGEFKSGPTGSWAFNDKINQYMTTSATTLPSADDISFPWGLTTQKRLVGWQSATGKYVTAANGPSTTIALDGDTWTAVFEYDAMGTGTNTDRMVRVGESTKIQSSNTTVLSCSASSGKVEASVDENGICIVKGLEKTDEGESVQVTVNYNGGETVVYNYIVLGSSTFDEDVVFEPEIQVIGIQNEELGDTDISFSSCTSWVCDNLVSWGNNGTIPGSTLQQSAYYAEGNGGEGCDTSRQVGLCLDPGIYGPHGATYVRDPSMDTFMNSGAVQLIMNELATFLQNDTYKSDWNNGAATGAVADYRNGVNTAFRIITMSTDPRYSYSTSDCGTVSCNESMMFQRAGNALKSGSIEGALNYVYNANPDKNCHSGNPFGSSPYCVTKHYLEAYMGYSGTGDDEITVDKFEITKEVEYVKTGDNSYTLTYTGNIKTPSMINLTSLGAANIDVSGCSKYGFTCTFEITGGPDADGAYQYKTVITVNDASPSVLKIPNTAEEKSDAAIRLNLSSAGASGLTDAFVIMPQSGGMRQRLVYFEEGAKILSIYFSPQGPNPGNDGPCDDVTSAMIAACESELNGVEVHHDANGSIENDPSLTCNLELVKECCGLANEVDHPNLTHKVCSNSCSYNTVGAVCDFYEFGDSQVESSTLYHVREGYKYDDGTNYEKNLGECIVNVKDYAQETDKSQFNVVDAAGNLLNVEAYADNAYCQVTCREEWDLTMGTFGSYMGAEAVRAGESFQIADADIFIRGDRYCYTTYLDTNKDNSSYYAKMQEFAMTLKQGYNKYSEAAHALSDLSKDAPDSGSGKASTDNKHKNSIDDKSGDWSGENYVGGSSSVESCRNWKKISYYVIDSTESYTTICGSGDSAYTCTRYRVKDSHYDYPIECTTYSSKSDTYSTTTGAIYSATELTDEKITVDYVDALRLSGEYNDVDNTGKGKYKKYKEDDGTSDTQTPTDYGRREISITCTNHENKADGDHDEIDCTSSGAGLGGATTGKYKLKSTDSETDVTKELNKMIVGYKSTKVHDGSSSNTGAGYIFKQYYDQLKDKLKEEMQGAEGVITGATYSLKVHAKMWYDCENFVLYTADYSGTNIGTVDVDNAKSNAGLDSNFKVLGDGGQIVEVGTVFNPKVAYSYDEVVYMNLLSNEKIGNHDNILVRNDRKNSSILNAGYNEYNLPSANEKDFFDESNPSQNLGNEYDVTLRLRTGDTEDPQNKLSYSKKTNKVYKSSAVWTSEDNTKPYEGDAGDLSGLKHGSGSDWKIAVCYVGQDGTAYTEGDSATYAPLVNKDDEGWKDGNCYLIGLHYYPNMNYIERGVSNSSFYKNKGDWWADGSATAVHGDTLSEAIANFNTLTTDGSTASSDLSLYRSLGIKNVFPVSMTTPRNLYKYAYVFTNIGSFGGEKAGRLMGHENAVFKNNTRTCFYEVIETICRCCGDATITNHTVTIPGVDENITETFGGEHSSDLGAIHSDPDKVTTSTQGSIGFYNTVSSLANLAAVSDTGERALAANWGEEAVFNYNGYNRYVTNKGYVAQKAIEAVGEDIYSPSYSAEYAYRLTPDAISEIKQNNMRNEYGVTYDEDHVKVYGKVLMVKSAAGSYTTPDSGGELYDEVSFEHYGSVFLENIASKYAKPNSNDGTFTNLNLASRQDGSSNTCTISETGETSTGATTAANLKNKMEGNCRWVDYIENDGSAGANYTASHPGCSADDDYRCVSEFRLAFK